MEPEMSDAIRALSARELVRRMRSGELHYVDHPRIGALVRITPFALAAPLAADAPAEPYLED